MATKSLLRSPKKLCVDETKRAHDCQGNSRHRLVRGDKRLKVFSAPGHSPDHYCVTCARTIIERDIARLNELLNELDG